MNARISTDLHFTAGVYYKGVMQMNSYILKLWMITNTTDAESSNIAFERIKYFVHNCLDSSILIHTDHSAQCEKFVNAGLRITTMPVDPMDQLVGIMLYHKLNAIMEGRISVAETEISSVMGDAMVYLHNEIENPEILDQPDWWTMPDLSQCDTDTIDLDKVVAMSQAESWRELDLDWPNGTDPAEFGNTIVFADFNKQNATE
jgi:hypothetical protein